MKISVFIYLFYKFSALAIILHFIDRWEKFISFVDLSRESKQFAKHNCDGGAFYC